MGLDRDKLVPLVTAAQSGDPQALNALFNVYYNDVYYFALKTVKDNDLACDITQETFMEIYSTLSSLKEPAAFVTWSKQITYHQCTRYFKKKKDVLVDENEDGTSLFDSLEEDNEEYIPDASLDKEDFRNTIMAMIDTLSEEQRAAVMMYYFDEMSVSQIASIQGVSEGTVKSRLNYARKSIKASVEEYEEKHNIKLHSLALAPLLLWLFRFDKSRTLLSPEALQSMAQKLSEKLGMQFQTAYSAANTAQSAVETAKHGAKFAKHAVSKKVAKAAVSGSTKVGMSFGVKFGFFVLSIFGATVVGGAVLAAVTILPNILSSDVLTSIFNPDDTDSSFVQFELSDSYSNVPSEGFVPFGEAASLGERLAGVYSNLYYAADDEGNVYSVTDCENPIVKKEDIKEQYCLDNAFVYLDHNDTYHVFVEGDEKWEFARVVGDPIVVRSDQDHFYSSSFGCVAVYKDKYYYMPEFRMNSVVYLIVDQLVRGVSELLKDRVDFVQYESYIAEYLELYVRDNNKTVIGSMMSSWKFSFGVKVYFLDYVSEDSQVDYDFSSLLDADYKTFYSSKNSTEQTLSTLREDMLPNGYTFDDVCQAFFWGEGSDQPVLQFNDGSVYVYRSADCSCGWRSRGWMYNSTLSALAKENKNFVMMPFYHTDDSPTWGDTERTQRIVVLLDDGRMFEVSNDVSGLDCANCEMW